MFRVEAYEEKIGEITQSNEENIVVIKYKN